MVVCSGPPNPPSIRTTTTPELRHHRWHVSARCTRSLRTFIASMLLVSKRRTRAQDVAGSPLEPHDGRCSDTSHQLRGSLVDAHPRLPLPDQRRSLAMVTFWPLTPTRNRRFPTTAAQAPTRSSLTTEVPTPCPQQHTLVLIALALRPCSDV